ncbi:MAG: zinc-dependent peptidase [Acidobacteriota bacterium]
MWRFFRRRKRERILSRPFPEEHRRELLRQCALLRALPPPLWKRLEDDLRVFDAERTWEPCGGLRLREEMRRLVSAEACILTLGRSVDAYDHVRSILLYPTRYAAPEAYEDEWGVVTEDVDEREGEAWERGIVVLSWSEVLADAKRCDGRNLVLHEFAHQLDLLDFVASAGFLSRERERFLAWRRGFLEVYGAFAEAVDSGKKVRVLDPYGAEDEAEFFAVATEAFFERPLELRHHHPGLYRVLSEYFALDPASWNWAPPPPEGEAQGPGLRRLKTRKPKKGGGGGLPPSRR